MHTKKVVIMKDLLRTLFKIRTPRKTLSISAIPPIESVIIRNNVKMTVTTAIDPQLWDWMLLSGWRLVTVRHDRRKCSTLPKDALTQLIAAGADNREKIHTQILSSLRKSS
jgi:hypothetical protein